MCRNRNSNATPFSSLTCYSGAGKASSPNEKQRHICLEALEDLHEFKMKNKEIHDNERGEDGFVHIAISMIGRCENIGRSGITELRIRYLNLDAMTLLSNSKLTVASTWSRVATQLRYFPEAGNYLVFLRATLFSIPTVPLGVKSLYQYALLSLDYFLYPYHVDHRHREPLWRFR